MSGRSVLGALRLQGVLLKQQSSLGFSDTVRRSFDLSLPLSVCSSCTFPSHTLVMSAGWERSELRCTAPHVSWERFPFIGIKEALRGEHQLCPRSRQTFLGSSSSSPPHPAEDRGALLSWLCRLQHSQDCTSSPSGRRCLWTGVQSEGD